MRTDSNTLVNQAISRKKSYERIASNSVEDPNSVKSLQGRSASFQPIENQNSVDYRQLNHADLISLRQHHHRGGNRPSQQIIGGPNIRRQVQLMGIIHRGSEQEQ